jgi:hypothetical protein
MRRLAQETEMSIGSRKLMPRASGVIDVSEPTTPATTQSKATPLSGFCLSAKPKAVLGSA